MQEKCHASENSKQVCLGISIQYPVEKLIPSSADKYFTKPEEK